MSKNILKRALLILPLLLMSLTAQEEVDAIENARQAKAAAERAAAAAEAATGAAIDAAAAKASKDARAKIVQGRKDEEARKQAEIDAAEEAELDAAASAAAKDAKRRMAAELGLEYEEEEDSTDVVVEDSTMNETEMAEEVVAKEKLGFSIGFSPSFGVISGESFTSIPIGGSFILTTPYGIELGPLDYTVSLILGGYIGQYNSDDAGADITPVLIDDFNPLIVAVGGNLKLLDLVFAEGHIGLIGKGAGFRGFAGVSSEKIFNSLELPFNLMFGSELFLSSDISGSENTSGWISIGARLDYDF
jgi:hypothetical protein